MFDIFSMCIDTENYIFEKHYLKELRQGISRQTRRQLRFR